MFKSLKRWAKQLKTNILALYLVLKRKDVKWYVKGFVALVVGYALSPIDLVPDFVPVLGYLDDLILLPIGIAISLKLVPSSILNDCLMDAEHLYKNKKPSVKIAGFVIALVWVAIIIYLSLSLYYRFF